MSEIDWENDMEVVRVKDEDEIVAKHTEDLEEAEEHDPFGPIIRHRSYIRRKLVFKLKVSAKSYDEIAEKVRRIYRKRDDLDVSHLPKDYDSEKAAKDVSEYLRKHRNEMVNNAKEMVMVEVERIDKMIEALWDRVRKVNGKPAELKAIDRIIKLQERKSKYLGLDDPEKIELADRTQEGFSFGWADPSEAPKFKSDNNTEDNDND